MDWRSLVQGSKARPMGKAVLEIVSSKDRSLSSLAFYKCIDSNRGNMTEREREDEKKEKNQSNISTCVAPHSLLGFTNPGGQNTHVVNAN